LIEIDPAAASARVIPLTGLDYADLRSYALSSDGTSVIAAFRAKALVRIVRIPLDDRNTPLELFTVTSDAWGIGTAPDGSLLVNIVDRPGEVVNFGRIATQPRVQTTATPTRISSFPSFAYPVRIAQPTLIKSDDMPPTKGALYLEDLHVGQKFTSGTYRMDESRIKAFAAEFDPQPFHLDDAAARQSVFRGLAASGWHTAAATMRLMVTSGLPFAGGLVGLGGEVAWARPTRPGDTLRVESEVLAIVPSRSKPNQGVVTVRSRTVNQDGDEVQVLTSKILVFKRSAHPTE